MTHKYSFMTHFFFLPHFFSLHAHALLRIGRAWTDRPEILARLVRTLLPAYKNLRVVVVGRRCKLFFSETKTSSQK